MTMMKTIITTALLGLGLVKADNAFIHLGNSPSPATLYGQPMVSFGDDTRAITSNVNDVPSPNGGVIDFSYPMSHREIGNGWGPVPWAGSYYGDVYFTGYTNNPLIITMPEDVCTFIFYTESNSFGTYTFTLTTASGASVIETLTNTGNTQADGFAISCNNGDALVTLTLSFSGTTTGFGIGNFHIAGCPKQECNHWYRLLYAHSPNHLSYQAVRFNGETDDLCHQMGDSHHYLGYGNDKEIRGVLLFENDDCTGCAELEKCNWNGYSEMPGVQFGTCSNDGTTLTITGLPSEATHVMSGADWVGVPVSGNQVSVPCHGGSGEVNVCSGPDCDWQTEFMYNILDAGVGSCDC